MKGLSVHVTESPPETWSTCMCVEFYWGMEGVQYVLLVACA